MSRTAKKGPYPFFMKKLLAGLIVVAGLGLGGVVAHQAVERDREYQRLIRQGDDALSRGQTFVAIEAFSGAIALKRGSMLAYLKRGEAHRRRGDSAETLTPALRDLRTAADLDPGATRAQEELGDVNLQLHRYANAAENYEAYLRLDDRSAPVFYKLALAARADGHLARAITALQDAVRLNPSFAEAHYVLGLCLKDRGQLREAQKALHDAIAIAPALIPAREELADLHRLQGQAADEIDQLEALAALDSSRPERQIAVGLAYARNRSPELAVTALGRAAERFHDYPGVYAALGQVWLDAAEERGDKAALRKALEALEPLATQSSADSAILGLYARALTLNGQDDEAERAFKQAADKFPIAPSVLPQYAAVAQRLGHLDDARQALVRYTVLVDDDRDQALHASQIAALSLDLDDPVSAVNWYQKSEALAAPDAALLAHLADAQLRVGQVEAAKETIARALAKDAKNPSVRSVALRIQRVAQTVPEEVKPQH
jgi:tetratricopeptide (TPR) repeat protein